MGGDAISFNQRVVGQAARDVGRPNDHENGSAAAQWGRPARNVPVCSQRAETRRSIAAKLRARQRTVDWKAFLAGSLAPWAPRTARRL
jgi:hypothetical protein